MCFIFNFSCDGKKNKTLYTFVRKKSIFSQKRELLNKNLFINAYKGSVLIFLMHSKVAIFRALCPLHIFSSQANKISL